MYILRMMIFGMSIMTAPAALADTGYVSEHLAQAQFTTRVKDRTPVDEITKLSKDFRKVYFFTDVRTCKGCKIKHQWWYKGKMVSEVKGKAKSDRYRWWTSKSLNDDMSGQWTVKVVIDGDVEFKETFVYYKPTLQKQQNAPINKRKMVEEIDDCETELRYFSEKLKDTPDDAYYQFMMKKLSKRCLSE